MRSGSAQGPFGVRSGSVRGLHEVRSRSARGSFGVCSGSVRQKGEKYFWRKLLSTVTSISRWTGTVRKISEPGQTNLQYSTGQAKTALYIAS